MRSNRKHTTEELERYIQLYLEEGTSLHQSTSKYNIPSTETVRKWVIKYTGKDEIRSFAPKSEVYTMKGKKITQEEKIEIGKDFLDNGLSYKEDAEGGLKHSDVKDEPVMVTLGILLRNFGGHFFDQPLITKN